MTPAMTIQIRFMKTVFRTSLPMPRVWTRAVPTTSFSENGPAVPWGLWQLTQPSVARNSRT